MASEETRRTLVWSVSIIVGMTVLALVIVAAVRWSERPPASPEPTVRDVVVPVGEHTNVTVDCMPGPGQRPQETLRAFFNVSRLDQGNRTARSSSWSFGDGTSDSFDGLPPTVHEYPWGCELARAYVVRVDVLYMDGSRATFLTEIEPLFLG